MGSLIHVFPISLSGAVIMLYNGLYYVIMLIYSNE